MRNAPFTSAAVAEKIKHFEERTGYELVVAACHASDPYPGALWRGGVLIGLILSALVLHFYNLHPRSLEILLVGACIMLAVNVMRLLDLQRFFVLPAEAERETAEKASALFSQFQSSSLGHQAAILLFFSLSEHKMHLLIDRDMNEKLKAEDLHEILSLLRTHFKKGDFQIGLESAISVLEEKVLAKAGKNPHPPLLSVPDRIFWLD
jgi:uncharacterized membrane protein